MARQPIFENENAGAPNLAEVQEQLERILRSQCFAQAGRSSDFLRFVVGQTLAGAASRLKGYSIGVEVFGRPVDFDPQADPLVRVEAGRLRRRLVEYYAGEGAHDPIRIELPRGSYAVNCEFAAANSGLETTSRPALVLTAGAKLARGGRWLPTSLALLLLAAVGVIAWQQRELSREREAIEASQSEPKRAEWPRILVVPFENLSAGDRRLDAFAGSMTEEVMLVLGELDLFVIATQASWYGPTTGTEDANVGPHDYVLSGSVREAGDRARITVRLVEAETGNQLWSRAYDEPLAIEDVPALQAQVAHEVAAVAAPYGAIFEAELARVRRSLHAPDLRDCLAQYYEYRRGMDPALLPEALACFQSLALRQPDSAPAWAGLAMLYLDDFGFRFGNTASKEASFNVGQEATARALAIDRDYFLANLALARIQFFDADPEFEQSAEHVLALQPDSAETRAYVGVMLVVRGDVERGVALLDEATKLSPNPPGVFGMGYALAHLYHDRPKEALAAAQRIEAPNWFVSHLAIAAAAGLAGDHVLAERTKTRLLQLYPTFETDAVGLLRQWRTNPRLFAAEVKGLEAAGLHLAAEPSD